MDEPLLKPWTVVIDRVVGRILEMRTLHVSVAAAAMALRDIREMLTDFHAQANIIVVDRKWCKVELGSLYYTLIQEEATRG